MATSRERFLQTLNFEKATPPWVRWGAFIWPETGSIWQTQGYAGLELGWHGEGLAERFNLDELLRVDPWYGPVPEFEEKVISEDERTRVFINHEGILMREFKERSDTSMPQFLKFPVENLEDFETLARERLILNAEQRFTAAWQQQVSEGRLHGVAGAANITAIGSDPQAAATGGDSSREESPRFCWADRWGGFFGSLRNLMGVQNLCLAFYDQPKLIERMMEERADHIIEITAEVFKYTGFEMFGFWEDMAYRHGPLMDPKMFRRFAFKHYRRVVDWLHSRGIKHIFLDSDGNITQLIPFWLEAGINVLWPFECQSGMDVVQVRHTYGHDLAMIGGIDKRKIAKGGETMRNEVDRVMPLVEDGGYIPEPDHSIPPDVSWPDFCAYVEYLKFRLGRG